MSGASESVRNRLRRERRLAARRHLRLADFLIDQGYYAGAGEMLWGALACALDALSRKHYGHDLGTNHARLDFIDDMGKTGRMLADDAFLFRNNAVALHSHSISRGCRTTSLCGIYLSFARLLSGFLR